jgi:hypothetical protein
MFLAEDDPESKPLCLPKSYPDVMVVQSRQDGDGDNEPRSVGLPDRGARLCSAPMKPARCHLRMVSG